MRHKPILIDQDDNFELFILQPVYLEKACSSNAYWINTRTGENCGQQVLLCEYKYNNDGTLRDKYEIDEDCYELRHQSEGDKDE